MSAQTPAPRRRHLMDPNNPQPQRRQDPMSLSQVQKWVMSTLAVTTILHLVVGLIIAAATIDADRTDARVGLLVISGIFGIIAVAAGRAIHQVSLLTPWLVLGVVPALVGAYFVF